MRSWTYSYKTSDGLRHESEMQARSKDEVYAELRKKGIRAIRVEERIRPIVMRGFRGLRKREWCIIGCVVVLCVGFALLSWTSSRRNVGREEPSRVARRPVHPGYVALANAVDEAMALFRGEFETIDRELLVNYRLVWQVEDTAPFAKEIERARNVVSRGRVSVRNAFEKLYGAIPEECREDVASAQELYGKMMDELDAVDEGVDGDECAIALLVANRGKWKVVRGEVAWNDPRLEKEFSLFRRNRQSGAMRWNRDFGKQRQAEISH